MSAFVMTYNIDGERYLKSFTSPDTLGEHLAQLFRNDYYTGLMFGKPRVWQLKNGEWQRCEISAAQGVDHAWDADQRAHVQGAVIRNGTNVAKFSYMIDGAA